MGRSNLRQNIIYNVFFQILNIIVPIFTAPYVFRVLGKEGIGIYSYSYSIAHYFSLFCMLGILNYGVREISMVANNVNARSKIFWQIYYVQLFAGLLSFLSYLVLIFTHVFNVDDSIMLLQGFFVISAILDVSWFLFGIENFKVTTIISSINKLLTTICIFILINKPSDVKIYILLLSLGSTLNNIFYWVIIRKYISFHRPIFKELVCHIKPIIILFIPVIAINIYKYIDKIMLGAMLDVSEVGIFEASEKLQTLPMCLIAAVGTVMLPRISNLVANKQSNAVEHYNYYSFILIMFLTIGMAFGLAGIAEPFIPLFYGDGYEKSISVLLWLLPSMVFMGWANIIRTQYLLPNKKDSVYCGSVIMGAIVNIIFNVLLIPSIGAVGAAISTAIAEMTVCIYQSFWSYKQMKLKRSIKGVLPFFFAGIVMLLSISNIQCETNLLTNIIRVLIGVVVYFILSSLFFRKELVTIFTRYTKKKC